MQSWRSTGSGWRDILGGALWLSPKASRIVRSVHTDAAEIYSHDSEKGTIEKRSLLRRQEPLQFSRGGTVQCKSPLHPFLCPGRRFRGYVQPLRHRLFVSSLNQVPHAPNCLFIRKVERALDEAGLKRRELSRRALQRSVQIPLEQLFLQRQLGWRHVRGLVSEQFSAQCPRRNALSREVALENLVHPRSVIVRRLQCPC